MLARVKRYTLPIALSDRLALLTFDPVAWAEGLPLGSLIRWNVSGDVVGADGADYRDAIHEAHTKRPDLKGWSYTHAWADPEIAQWAQGLPDNVRIVASMDDPTDVDRARSMGWKTIAQVTETADGKGFTDDEARKVRAFAVHGPGQKKARVSLAARRSLAVVDRDVALTGSERDRYIAERFGA